jgi:hypothetical protein
MSTTDPLAFVRAQTLAPAGEGYATTKALNTFEAGEDEASAFLNSRNIVSFVSGVAGQARRDVLNATLFAQLAADNDHPRMKQPEEWLNRYRDVLNRIGWNLEAGESRNYSSEVNEFDMNKALLKIMGGALLGPVSQLAIITATLEALKELGEGSDDIKVFERRLQQLDTMSFQLGLASEENEAVSLTLSTFSVKTTEGTRRILFFKGGKDEVKLSYHLIQGTLNDEIYGEVRQGIVEMLGDRAKKSLLGIKLAKV